MTRGERRNLRIGLAFISPWIIGFLAFTLYPVLASVYYSFCDYDVLTRPIWIGLLNYHDLFTDSVFWKSLYNTFYFAAFVLPLGLIIALADRRTAQSIVARAFGFSRHIFSAFADPDRCQRDGLVVDPQRQFRHPELLPFLVSHPGTAMAGR